MGCGWFDWFIQLFRQTWTGQTEILSALRADRDRPAILPWDHDRAAHTRLVEGFPGRACATAAVSGLVERGLPLSEGAQQEARGDTTGDLIDALVLLAGSDALAADHAAIPGELARRGLLCEGWIYR